LLPHKTEAFDKFEILVKSINEFWLKKARLLQQPLSE
jgi:hypothetical protein